MQRHTTGVAALLALAGMLLPGAAEAQPFPFPNPWGPVSFEEVNTNSMGGLTTPDRLVIRNQGELDALKARLLPQDRDRLVPDGAVDFDDEMLIAVFMGEFPRSGHSIKVTEIERQFLFLEPWRPVPGMPRPPMTRLTVKLEETHETGGITLPALTQPFTIVKLAKMNALVTYEVSEPAAPEGEIPFELITASDTGGPATAKQAVIRSQFDLERFFDGNVPADVTAGNPVDFRTEMVVAIGMGMQPQTGHKTSVDRIERRAPTLSANPIPGLPTGGLTLLPGRLTVHYSETHEPRGRFPTQPYVVVKLRKLPVGDTVEFVRALTPDEAFKDITRVLTNASAGTETEIYVDSDGNVRLERRSFRLGTVRPPPVVGTADPVHVADLRAAIHAAEFHTLPNTISGPNPVALGGSEFFFRVLTKNTPELDKKVTGWLGNEGVYASRLDPVNEVLNKIEANINVTPPPSPRNFTLVQLELTEPSSFGPINRTIAINADASVEVTSRHPVLDMGNPAHNPPVTGTASEREMRALEDAVKLAQMAQVPDPLNVMVPMHLPSRPFRLVVKSDDARHEGQTSGQYGYYGQYQLEDLVETAKAIGERLSNPNAPNFLLVQLETDSRSGFGGLPVSNTVAITDDGEVEVRQAHPLLDTTPGDNTARGQLTADELRELQDAVKLANMETVPGVVGPVFLLGSDLSTDATSIIVPNNTFRLTVKSHDARHEGSTQGMLDMYGQFTNRLKPLIDLVQRIGARVSTTPSGPAFTSLSRSVFRPSPLSRPLDVDPSIEVLWGTSETFELDADGKAKYTWSAPNVRTRPIEGQATDAELDALNDALRAAAVGRIPALDRPVHIVAAPTFELEVRAPVSSHDGRIDGELGYYVDRSGVDHSSKLQPVMRALDAIIDRLRAEDSRPVLEEITGTVDVRGRRGWRSVFLLGENDGDEIRVRDWQFASQLIKFDGHEVTVSGTLDADELVGEELLNPVHRDLSGHVIVRGEQAFLETGMTVFPMHDDPHFEGPLPGPGLPWMPGPITPMPPIWPPAREVETFGPAAGVLTKAGEHWATVDAWVFQNDFGLATKAYVAGVYATAKEDSDLTRRGRTVNSVDEGETITLLRLSRSGNYVLAKPDSGRSGFLHPDKIDFGPERLHTLPVDPPVFLPLGAESDDNGGLLGGLGD